MRYGKFIQGMQGFMALHQRTLEADFASRAREDAERMDAAMRMARPSGNLGNGRLASLSDAASIDLFNPAGIFIGAFGGRPIFFNGEGPLLTYLRTGGGKGRDLLLPNLAHLRSRSLLVVDVKDGENCYASHEHRVGALGTPCVYLNPYGLHGLPNTAINPLAALVAIVQAGKRIDTEASEIAQILLPMSPKQDDNAWVRKGANRLLSMRMEYLAHFEPEECSLTGLWRFVSADKTEMDMSFAMMATCGVESIERRARGFTHTLESAPKQFEAYKADAIEALDSFEPGKSLALATEKHDFDFGRLKREPHTVYLILPSEKLGVAAPWISLILNHAIERIAMTPGRVQATFLLDEFPQLPPAPAILKSLRLYRGKGIQLWFFAQGRFSMEDRWSRDAVREIEDQAALTTYRAVREPSLIRDLEMLSGNRTILARGSSHNGGIVETAAANLSETRRTVLQTEDIVGLPAAKQIIKLTSLPHLMVTDCVPFFSVDPWKHQIKDVRDLHLGSE